MKNVKMVKLDKKKQQIEVIHRAIKSAGRRYTISLPINCTGNPELRSFCLSKLHSNNACRKHLILSFYQRMKKSSI